jgi:hypothetical protein
MNTQSAVSNERRVRELEGLIQRAELRVTHLEALPPDTMGKDRMLHVAVNTLRKYKRMLRRTLTLAKKQQGNTAAT